MTLFNSAGFRIRLDLADTGNFTERDLPENWVTHFNRPACVNATPQPGPNTLSISCLPANISDNVRRWTPNLQLNGFELFAIPDPSTYAQVLVGRGALVFLRRKHRI